MAYTAIDKHTAFFNNVLFNGTTSAQSITGVGHQPDLTWIKVRDANAQHVLQDSLRGATGTDSYLMLTNAAASDVSDAITSFDSDGFSLGTDANDRSNYSGQAHVSWNWKAGTTGSGNTGGSGSSKTYSYSTSTTGGFSIIKYQGNGTGGHTIPHHLGAAPTIVIIKDITATNSWIMKMADADGYFYFEKDDAITSNSTWLPCDANNITLANSWGAYNTNNVEYLIYCWTPKPGFSHFGTYRGNNNNDGHFFYTGMRPELLILKRHTSEAFIIVDSKRGTQNAWNYLLNNSNAGEVASVPYEFLSNGVKFRGTTQNATDQYSFMAFGQSIVGSNNVPNCGE